ncbi:DEAD/DEAH box helicase [Amycolatopsis sp. QT-25]|uniref:DEAD/DEAH box helicase n=1 Tax=Amycolatopsis sp. QT-25 TaxID=3034022 RepID=UPI0023EB4BC8|nr:DEAD/DEAH box helicase [Amycolatopsis sp. QT-25]WET79952.1 DEAD/DEAH box helicase [Amycolatopsis sp. QT-25]
MNPEASLFIGFDVTRTQALLRARLDFVSALGRLLERFPAGRFSDKTAAVVPVDEFLIGLEALADWPEPETVTWDATFQATVEEMLDDAEEADRQLHGDGQIEIGSSEVDELLGPSWCGELTDFQRRDIARLISLGHSANFSVPGAGKTRVALAVFAAMREKGKVDRLLVVGPKAAYEAWLYEAKVCFKRPLEVKVVTNRLPSAADLLLVNYERLNPSLAGFARWLQESPGMMILDEAHRMKLGAAGVYGSACMALGPLSRVRMILSGTPAPNGPKDLESLLAFVWPGRGRRVVRQAIGGGDLGYASSKLRPLYTRTTKQELGLPPVSTRVRRVEMSPLHREIYDAMVGQFTARAERNRNDFESLGRAVLRLLMAATSPALLVEGATKYEPLSFQIPPLEVNEDEPLYVLLRDLSKYEIPPKYQEALTIVADNARNGLKTLVWASFVRSIKSLEVLFKDFSPAVVHGGTADRAEQLRTFREDPACAVLVSNPATLGEGVSLHQVCHDAVYVDRDFQAGRFLQSLDRIHRLGLAHDTETRVTILEAQGSIDEIVALRLKEKLEFMGQILDDPSVRKLGDPEDEIALAGGLDAADIQAIIGRVGAILP